jgi:serine/threonine-protein kinase
MGSLDLAGSIIKARYRVNAVAAVSRDIVVYAAEEIRFGRPIALKVLREDVAADADFVAAVREQASALAMAAHVDRGLPRVYECGTTDAGELFIALERTKGPALREVLDARGILSPAAALRIASQVGEALESLHHNRILHGQLGPDTVLLVRDGDGTEHVSLTGVETTAAYRTPSGLKRRDALATPYLAPEQVERGETTPASDQYALGMLLREMLTNGKDTELPADIERIVATALDAEPARRYASISEMVNDMWIAQTALADDAPARPIGNVHASGRRRARSGRRHVALRIAAAVAAGGIVAIVIWFTLAGHRATALTRTPAAPEAPTLDAVAQPAAAPRLVPVVQPPAAPARPQLPQRRERPAAAADGNGSDGGAIIDWLLSNNRR